MYNWLLFLFVCLFCFLLVLLVLFLSLFVPSVFLATVSRVSVNLFGVSILHSLSCFFNYVWPVSSLGNPILQKFSTLFTSNAQNRDQSTSFLELKYFSS